jgi:two-component system cell cycle response regulator
MHAENIIPFLAHKDRLPNVLAVDDDSVMLSFMGRQIHELGYGVLQASDGREALDILKNPKNEVDVVLMDRMMPGMDGLSAVRRMKEDAGLRKIPVIMVTNAVGAREMQEGLEAGVFYYLIRPVAEGVLKSILLAATREAEQGRVLGEELKRHSACFSLIHTCKFQLRTLSEAEYLAPFIARCFPDPERALPGLAELLINAVEHGRLRIGYDRKSNLLESGIWRAEIERRQEMEEYRDVPPVEAVFTHKDNGVCAIITDPGEGFDWKRFMTIDPSRSGDNHGRGIAQANAISFDKLVFNEKGNQAVAFVSHHKNLEW